MLHSLESINAYLVKDYSNAIEIQKWLQKF